MFGMTAIAAAITAPAIAGPGDANLWVGLQNGRDGVLINEATGEAWLTGVCLKRLATAEKSGEIWRSRTIEDVSIGQATVRLDQTFTLDPNPESPKFTIESANRGGPQRFIAVVEEACQSSAPCRALLDAPTC